MKKQLLLFLSLCFLVYQTITAQSTYECGYYTKPIPTQFTASDVFAQDRFGNTYTQEELNVSNLQMDCTDTGFFELRYTAEITPEERDVFCRVFQYLSDLISPVSPNANVVIQVKKSNPDGEEALDEDVYGTASPLYYPPSCGIQNSIVWEKINTEVDYQFPENFADAYIQLNPHFDLLWHTDESDIPNDESNLVDLYTVVLHETMHILGFVALIDNNGVSTAGFNSRWDTHLNINNEYLITEVSNSVECCDEQIFNDQVNLSLPDDISSGCDNEIFFEDIAPINATYPDDAEVNSNLVLNILSHLDPCGINQEDYVMFAGLEAGPNTERRMLTIPEQNILCALGYRINENINCSPDCEIVAVDDFIEILDASPFNNPSIGLLEFLENDIYQGLFTLLDIKVSEGYILNGSWRIDDLPYGQHTLTYTISSCDDNQCDQATVNLLFLPPLPVLPECPLVDCNENLFCHGDFENFIAATGVGIDLYHPQLGLNSFTITNDGNLPNTPDVFFSITDDPSDDDGFNFSAQFNSTPFFGNIESMYLPLTQGISRGCSGQINLRAFADFDSQIPPDCRLFFYGSQFPPCENITIPTDDDGFFNPECGISSFDICDFNDDQFEVLCLNQNSPQGYPINQIIEIDDGTINVPCDSEDNPNPDFCFEIFGTSITLQYIGEDGFMEETINFQNNDLDEINYIMIIPHTGNNSSASFHIDDIDVRADCENNLTVFTLNSPGTSCIGNTTTLTYEVCLNSDEVDPDPSTSEVHLTANLNNAPPITSLEGISLGGDFDQNGKFTIPVLNVGDCVEVSLDIIFDTNSELIAGEEITVSIDSYGFNSCVVAENPSDNLVLTSCNNCTCNQEATLLSGENLLLSELINSELINEGWA